MVRVNAKFVALTAVFTAAYAIGVIVLAPISFYIYQCRIADSLIALSTVFGLPTAIGTALGCAIANAYAGYGIIDIVGGSIANFIAAIVGYYIASKKFKGSILAALLAESLIISGIVGSYLSVVFEVPLIVGFTGVLVGSLISINVLGYVLVKTIRMRIKEV